ncbi:hypothetical protein A3K72_00150, partial [Candidatus Woesearchaeota archaeon RBG_13_36_6]
MQFTAHGHPNIRASHKTTFEFTKDRFLTKTGDCIVGVNADFSLSELKKLLKNKRIKITIKVDKKIEEIIAQPNKGFDSEHEIVIRKTNFVSKRTLAINANKAAIDFDKIREKLKNP